MKIGQKGKGKQKRCREKIREKMRRWRQGARVFVKILEREEPSELGQGPCQLHKH